MFIQILAAFLYHPCSNGPNEAFNHLPFLVLKVETHETFESETLIFTWGYWGQKRKMRMIFLVVKDVGAGHILQTPRSESREAVGRSLFHPGVSDDCQASLWLWPVSLWGPIRLRTCYYRRTMGSFLPVSMFELYCFAPYLGFLPMVR